MKAAAGGAGEFAAGEELADFVPEGAAAFFREAEPAEEFGLVGGRIMGLSQKCEQTITEGHVRRFVARRAGRALNWTDEKARLMSAR